jgi:poly(A) polymerase
LAYLPTIEDGLYVLHLLHQTSSINAKMVGGCVRDWCRAHPIHDIDIAVDQPPNVIIDWAKSQGFSHISIGISHGTVGIVIPTHHGLTSIASIFPSPSLPGQLIQLTTLRQDLESHGRHATVAFTTHWQDDARRRDFTINSMYMDKDRCIFDPCGGKKDLHQRILRFIGCPSTRIKEDFLRIMRFFRFAATLDIARQCPVFDQGLDACVALKNHLRDLCLQRVSEEWIKLLGGAHWHPLITLMQDHHILPILTHGVETNRLPGVVEKGGKEENDDQKNPALMAMARLGALFYRRLDAVQVQKICMLTTVQKKLLVTLFYLGDTCIHEQRPLSWLRRHYDGWVIGAFMEFLTCVDPPYQFLLSHQLCQENDMILGAMDSFPLKAGDVITFLGVEPGPMLGKVLKETKQWWFSSLKGPSYDECLAYAAAHIGSIPP